MLIDTHCHLDNNDYENLDELITETHKVGIKRIVVSGYDVKSSNDAVVLAHKYDNVYATVGFHPHDSGEIFEQDYKLFDEWLNDEKVVGIGEIGLDYHYDLEEKTAQTDMFKKQIMIAYKHNKPIVVHNRDASEDIYNILKDYNVKGIIHCFNDTSEIAQKFIGLGFLLGVGGIITFKKSNIKSVIEDVPLEYIVLETDSPYLAPEPFRGRKNSPVNLPIVATTISNIKGIEYTEVASRTTSNAERIFDFQDNL